MNKKLFFSATLFLLLLGSTFAASKVSARASMGEFVGEKVDVIRDRVMTKPTQGEAEPMLYRTQEASKTPMMYGERDGVALDARRGEMGMNSEEREAKIQEVQEKRAEMKEQIKEKKLEQRKDMAARHTVQMEKRFSKYAERLGNMIPKFQSRIDSMTEEGIDTSVAQSKLDEASAVLVLATEQAGTAISAFADIEPASFEDQKALAKSAQDAASLARSSYKAALDILKEVLESMKGLE